MSAPEPAELEPCLTVLLVAGQFTARGASGYTVRLLQHLDHYGVQARAICQSAALLPRSQSQALPIQEYPSLTLPILGRWAVRRLIEDIHPDRPDLIHVQTRDQADLGIRVAEQLQVPYVITIHDFPAAGTRVPFRTDLGLKIIAVSDPLRADLIGSMGIPPELIEVIPSGVEIDGPEPGRKWPAADLAAARVPVVGTAGPIEPIKGQPFFLQAARQVLDAGVDAEFLVAGTGPDEAQLRRLARVLGIAERVTFVPYIREYTEVIAAMDVFCLPSLQQGLGTVMLQAMALGRPVVATAVGGVHSVVQSGVTGFLIPPGDSRALADAIVHLIRNPAVARQVGQNGRELVARQFEVSRMVRDTARLYRRTLAAYRLRRAPPPGAAAAPVLHASAGDDGESGA